ncbi:MAG: four-carbon acid sugar kinase family protein [Lachnospiraceae bacterium]
MPLIGAVADDLTGATTTGVLLARSKAKTAVFFNEEAAEKAKGADQLDAILVSSNSRPLPGEEAYAKVRSATMALKRMGVRYFTKRIDTTLRGGIGIEINAMMEVIKDDVIAVVVPAMPQSRRIVVGGFSIIDGVALINTPVAQDVRTPVKENFVPVLLSAQAKQEVGLINLGTVLKGKDTIKKELEDMKASGLKIIVVDAITLEDIEAIANACVELEWNVLAVDPGAFTAKLALARGLVQAEEPNVPAETMDGKGKTVLITAGSATPVTKKQMEILCEDPRHVQISIDPVPFIDGGEAADQEVERAVRRAVDLLAQPEQPRVILLETALSGPILNLDEEDGKRGYAEGMSANRINAGLGSVVEQILDQAGREKIAGLYTTGGDTMVNVCFQLGVECLEVLDYVIAQTDVGRMIGTYQGMPIIGKGGLTGHDTIVLDIVDRLFKEATREKL